MVIKMQKDERTSKLLEIGVKVAAKHGLANVTRRHIAEKGECSESLVNVYLGNLTAMRAAIKKHAKKQGVALPDKDAEALLGAKLRKSKGYGGARRGAGRPVAATV